jgi:protein-L-isoaspartate(D-aspartate) O-methyltransferase
MAATWRFHRPALRSKVAPLRKRLEQGKRAMIDFALARTNMVESQVRSSDVTDRRIIRAMQVVPREAFVPERVKPLAYMDEAVPLSPPGGRGRVLMAPRTFARLLQLATPGEADTVLVIGSSTGYSLAVIAGLVGHVVALEEDQGLLEAAVALASEPAGKIARLNGPLKDGVPGEAPFDVIFVEGGVEEVPAALLDQLKDGGRLVAVLVEGGVGKASIWRRSGASFDHTRAFDAGAAVLPGFARAPQFVF